MLYLPPKSFRGYDSLVSSSACSLPSTIPPVVPLLTLSLLPKSGQLQDDYLFLHTMKPDTILSALAGFLLLGPTLASPMPCPDVRVSLSSLRSTLSDIL